MPIYEYRCNNCGNIFESLRSINEADLPIACTECKAETANRVVSKCFSKVSGSSGSSHNSCSGCQSGSCSGCH